MEAVYASEKSVYFNETMALYPRSLQSSYLPPQEPEISHDLFKFTYNVLEVLGRGAIM
jgi:hypothetical protein